MSATDHYQIRAGALLCSLLLAGGCDDLWPLDKDLTCGDNIVTQQEVCDGTNLNNKTCKTEGYAGGTLACSAGCLTFNLSGCYKCGDGKKDVANAEVCDGAQLNNKTCVDQGYEGGVLKCRSDCKGFDTSGCYKCGDGKKDVANAEVCDGADLDKKTCKTEGFQGGTLRCKPDCKSLDIAACYKCGDGIKHEQEGCDGTNLGGLTCASGGFAGGVLKCKSDCSGVDPSSCYDWSVAAQTNWGKADKVESGRGIALDSAGDRYITGSFTSSVKYKSILEPALTSAGAADIMVVKQDSDRNILWAVRAGGTGKDEGRSIAVDGGGNVFVVGMFTAQADFGSLKATSAGKGDIFLAKLDSAGMFQWVKKAGGAGDDKARAIALDSSGNIYITGSFTGQAKFGSFTLTSTKDSSSNDTADFFVAKLNSAGTFQWAKGVGGVGADGGNGVAVDSKTSESYITGDFVGSVSFGSTKLISAGDGDIFVAKLNSAGTFAWAKGVGGKGADEGNALALDAKGGLRVTGTFNGTATFGSTTVTSCPPILGSGTTQDIFVASLSANSGTFSWVLAAGGAGKDGGNGVAVDFMGNSHITGQIGDGVAMGGFFLSCTGVRNLFVAELDPAGKVVRAAAPLIPIPGDTVGRGSAVDSYGRGYHVGAFNLAAAVGKTVVGADGISDLWVLSLYSSDHFFEAMTSGTYADLEDVWASGPTDVWAVGGAVLLHYDGAAWKPVSPGAAKSGLKLNGVWGSGPTDVHVVGEFGGFSSPSGIAYHYNGAKWTATEFTSGYWNKLTAVWGTGPNHVIAVGLNFTSMVGQRFMEYKYDGVNWVTGELRKWGSSGGDPRLGRIWGSSASDIYTVGGYQQKYYYPLIEHYNGKWSSISSTAISDYISGIWGHSATDIYLTSYSVSITSGIWTGNIIHYDGTNWASILSGQELLPLDVWGSGATDIFVTLDSGFMMHHDGAKLWTQVPTPAHYDLNRIWGSNATTVFVVGDRGTILRKR